MNIAAAVWWLKDLNELNWTSCTHPKTQFLEIKNLETSKVFLSRTEFSQFIGGRILVQMKYLTFYVVLVRKNVKKKKSCSKNFCWDFYKIL